MKYSSWSIEVHKILFYRGACRKDLAWRESQHQPLWKAIKANHPCPEEGADAIEQWYQGQDNPLNGIPQVTVEQRFLLNF